MIKPRSSQLNIVEEMKTDSVNQRLIVATGNNGLLHYFYLVSGRIHSFFIEDLDSAKAGSIIIGSVANVCKGIDGYFVNINKDTQVFLPGSAAEKAILINRAYNGKLYEGDLVIIQISKEEYKNKKAAATTKIKYPAGLDHERLTQISRTCPKYTVIHKGLCYLDILHRNNKEFNSCNIICADEVSFKYVNSYYKETINTASSNLQDIPPIKMYDDTTISLGALYSLRSKFDEISNEKVWLKSGGYLYINPTEAMTVIDINTGKTNGKNREKTILATNMEAIEEIAYQIKARNLSGIIIIDLINSKADDFNTILTKHMSEHFNMIKPAPKLEDITKLGLAEVTRQKILPDIYELLPKFDKTILM